MKSELKVHWKLSNNINNNSKEDEEDEEEEEKIICVDVDQEEEEDNNVSNDFRPKPPSILENGGENFNGKNANLFARDSANLTNVKKFDDDEKRASSSHSNLIAAGSKKIASSSHSDVYKHRQFCKNLKTLNQNVFDWIDKHLKSNPYLDLTPVFNDYVTHYKSLQLKFNQTDDEKNKAETSRDDNVSGKNIGQQPVVNKNNHVTSSSSTNLNKSSSTHISFGFQSNATTTTTAAAAAIDPNSSQSENGVKFAPVFGAKNSLTVPPTISFGFGNNQSASPSLKKSKPIVEMSRDREDEDEKPRSTNPFKKFRFVNNSQSASTTSKPTDTTDNNESQQKPSLFAFLTNQNRDGTNGDEKEGDNDGDEYEPPKPESVQIEEEDAFYSIKCKLFYMDGKYVEKGVGTLYLKQLDNGTTQLLIRNDTALGNVLLNIRLSESMPCTRTGKNNVTIACVPNPPLKKQQHVATTMTSPSTETDDDDQSESSSAAANTTAAVVMMLIRVKTSEDADELHEKISEAKASA